ncbi:RNA pseudouridine synthase 6, chloroplastic isoform X1 [Typha angustifolia]|uniref:RNA pseudouridine synthase 6, chloroplastic isoform X1 n=1 Tax=Typha angustifolia TaxID=59011 RepID=UPI003C2F7C25
MPKSAAALASLLSNALLPPLWASSRRNLIALPPISRGFATSHHLKNRGHAKNPSWVLRKKASSLPRSSAVETVAAESAASSDGYPDRLLPCPLQSGSPRVEHLVVPEGGIVGDYICKALHLPPLFVADLIHFGAVHYALVCPNPPPSATPEQFRIFKEVTEPSVLKKRSSLKGKTVREAQKTFRITDANQFVESGTYLRVHVHPKRFPRCYEVDWKSRIIAVTDSYVVIDKPAATSVGGTTDNIEECCATFASRALGLETTLRTTHQIDNCTEGCVVLARTKDFCSVFHGFIREKQVKKLYLALAAEPVPLGVISHYMRPVNMAPRLVSKDSIGGWHLCQLEVLECKEVPWPNLDIGKVYDIDNCGWPSQKAAYECKINLLTGKTHQVRAQLAAIGSPIVGDSMYMPAALAEMNNLGINPFGRERKNFTSDDERISATEAWISQHGKEPNTAIGLQASHISWHDGKCSYEAGVPWWRQEVA